MDLPHDHDIGCRRRPALARAWEDVRGGRAGWPARGASSVRWPWLWSGLPAAIDRLTRHADRVVSRSFHGTWQRLFMQAHSLVPTFFMLLAILFTALGPTPRFRGWLAVGTMAAAVAGYWLFVRLRLARRAGSHGQGLFVVQAVLLASLGAALFAYVGFDAPEAAPAPYSNLFAPVMALLMAVAALGHGLAWWVMRAFPDADRALLAELLARTELFDVPEPPQPTPRRIWHGVVNAPLYHPLHLLLMPALPVIAVPAAWVVPVGVAGLVCAWLLLTFSGMHDRLGLMIKVVRQYFLLGGQLVVSLVIIGLALARVAGVDYVTTLLDSASARVILYYVLAAYTALWLYEYWLNRALSERILPLLQPEAGMPERLAWIRYPIDPAARSTRVHTAGRSIELFAGGRVVVTGAYTDPDSRTVCGQWRPYERGELFQRLADTAARLGVPWAPDIHYRSRVAAAEVDKRAKLYFNVMNLLLIGLLAGAGWWLHSQHPPEAVVEGTRLDVAATGAQPVSLARLVFDDARADRPAIMVAASGGGTRAALYTASLLRGLAAIGRIDDVVLVSGVSGGGAALAYFALHHATLRATPPGACDRATIKAITQRREVGADPWCHFIVTMAQPYIDDVLRGASQFNVAGPRTFGHLLAESFARRFGDTAQAGTTLADVHGLGLILNTTLAGHPARESVDLAALWSDRDPGPKHDYAVHAGGRLIFTNLQEVGAFPTAQQAAPEAPDMRLPFVIVGADGVRLSAAAALSANFPPVFSNGAVELVSRGQDDDQRQRYWVTDGGAADNRGIVSLLYALRSMLLRCEDEAGCSGPARPIHLIVADASALGLDYVPDRGGGAILGASTRFASQLALEGLDRARRAYLELRGGTIGLHHLAMPATLRVRGGLGTHWSMPRSVTLRDICEPLRSRARSLAVDEHELMALIAALHDAPQRPRPVDTSPCQPDADPRRPQAAHWLARDPHARAWAAAVEALGGASAAAR